MTIKENNAIEDVLEELERAESKFAPFNSAHEGFAVLKEEVDELWDAVKLNPKKIIIPESHNPKDHKYIQKEKHKKMMREEAVQVAAMGLKFVKSLDNNWEND